MFGSEFFSTSLWWICPILMIVICLIIMRGQRGSMMCGFGFRDKDRHHINASDSAADILDKRYAYGEIDHEEYEKKKNIFTKATE